MTLTVDERIALLRQVSDAWTRLMRLVDSIPDSRMTEPQTIGRWSGKDLIAHIATWQEVGIRVVRRIEAGGPEEWPEATGEALDVLNAELLAPWRNHSLEEVRAYLTEMYDELVALAASVALERPNTILDVTADHYDEHWDDFTHLAGT